MDMFEVEDRFMHHPPTSERVADLHDLVRESVFSVVQTLEPLVVDCREKELAVQAMEQAVFWYNAAVARRMNGGPVV